MRPDHGRRLRVLQVLGSSAGGVARHVAQITAAARAAGVDARVAGPAALRTQIVGDEARPGRYADLAITDRPGMADLAVAARLRQLARGADVVHAHGLRAGAFAVLAARTLPHRPAVLVTLHNLPVGPGVVRAVARVLEVIVARGADAVLGVSGDLVARARARGARDTERALVPAPPRAQPVLTAGQMRERLGVAPTAALLVTVARLAPQKGLDLLVDTAGLLQDGPQAVHWVVAGDGPLLAGLREQVQREELPVEFLGRRDDVADLLAAADVVVSTAYWEGQPLGVQEALAAGAAVVATDVGGTREVTGAAAVLVPPHADALARAVRALLADPGRRADLSTAARAQAATLPTLGDTMDQLIRWWQRLA